MPEAFTESCVLRPESSFFHAVAEFPDALRAGNLDGGSGILPSRASLASIAHLLLL